MQEETITATIISLTGSTSKSLVYFFNFRLQPEGFTGVQIRLISIKVINKRVSECQPVDLYRHCG